MFSTQQAIDFALKVLARVSAYVVTNPKKAVGAAFAIGTLFGVVLF